MSQPSNDTPVRVGLVGLGGHGHTLQNAAAEAPNLSVAAVYDVDPAETRMAAERFGCTAAPSYDALLAENGLEAVVLGSPNRFHRAQAEAAFAAGLDVFVEKPITNTVEDGLAVVHAAERAGQVLMVGHNMRYSRSVREARQVLASGRLGEIVTCELHFSADNTHRLPPDAWRLRPDDCPMMPVMQLGIHGVDLLHHLIGRIDEVTAYARSVTTPVEVVDSVSALFRTENGVLGTLVSNYCTQVGFEMHIAGTVASIRLTPHRIWVREAAATDWHGEGTAEEATFFEYDLESYPVQLVAFGRHVRDRTRPVNDGWAGLQALGVVEAMQQSLRTGARVGVPHFEVEAPSPV